MPFGKKPDYDVLLETLFQLRIGVGLTQKEISARLKIPQSTVSKVESGARKIDLIELRLWCNVCGLTLSEFVEKFESNLDEKE